MGCMRATITLLLLASITVGASQTNLGTLEADAVSGAGHAQMRADLIGYWPGRSFAPNDPAATWTLEAATVELTQETIEGTTYVLATRGRTDPDVDRQSQTRHHASIRVASSHGGAYTFVANNEARVEVRGANVNAAPMQGGRLSEPEKDVDQQPPLTASWSKAISISSAEGAIVVEGDFTLGLWGTVIEVQHDEGQEQWTSGLHNQQNADPDGNLAVADEGWLYLRVSDGRLVFPPREILPATLMAAAGTSSFAVEGSLQASSADGVVLGHAVEAEDVTVSGSLSVASIDVGEDRLAFAVEGEADSIVLGGQRIAVAPQNGGVSWLWGLLLIPLLAALAWYAWRRPMAAARVHGPVAPPSTATTKREERGVGYYALAKAALGGRGGRRVLRRSNKAAHLHPGFVEVLLVRGIALLRLSRPEQALGDFDAAWQRLIKPRSRAVAALYACKACIYMQDLEAAREWLRDAYNLDPGFVTSQIHEPLFNALADSALVKGLRANPARGGRMPPGSIDPSFA